MARRRLLGFISPHLPLLAAVLIALAGVTPVEAVDLEALPGFDLFVTDETQTDLLGIPFETSPGAYQGYLTSQPFYVDRAEFNLNSAALGVPISVRLYANDISYAAPSLNSEERGIAAGTQLLLSATVALVGSTRRSVINFTATGLENIDNEVRIGGLYRMGPRLSTGLSWIYTHRISSNSAGNYTDNRIVFTVTYGTGLSTSTSAPAQTY